MTPWGAKDLLFWFVVTGLGLAAFGVLIAVTTISLNSPTAILVRNPQAEPVSIYTLQVATTEQTCASDVDCTVVSTHCSGCECGEPVNARHAAKYEEQLDIICRNYDGGICEYYCSTPYPRCLAGRCVLGPAPEGQLFSSLELDFFAGGSIFGSSFQVRATRVGWIMYEERSNLPGEPRRIERRLTQQDYQQLQNAIESMGLLTLPSQDFTREPLLPDQAYYQVRVGLAGQTNTFKCGIPPSGQPPTSDCQRRIDALRITLNQILGSNIQ